MYYADLDDHVRVLIRSGNESARFVKGYLVIRVVNLEVMSS